MTAAQKCLRRLLDQGERAWARTGEPKASLLFSEASNPEYLGLQSFSEKQTYHAALLHAEHVGAITVEWDTGAGHQNQVKRIRLRDGDVLARLLEAVPRWLAIEEALRACSPLMERFPILNGVIAAWREGRKPRGVDPGQVSLLVDAAKAIDYCERNTLQDVTVRRLSTRLGFDSKHLEALAPALDLLRADRLDDPPTEREDLFSALGIVKHPLPVLLAGPALIRLAGKAVLNAPVPYVGLAPNSIEQVEPIASCRRVLSIENLTTFHELTETRPQDTLLLYSNGMPSPSWKRFYDRVLDGLPDTCQSIHWGDIDVGGYRVAAQIAVLCRARGRKLHLYMMNPVRHPKEHSRRALEQQEMAYMLRLAKEWEWEDELKGIQEQPLAYEQEALDLLLPSS